MRIDDHHLPPVNNRYPADRSRVNTKAGRREAWLLVGSVLFLLAIAWLAHAYWGY